MSERVSVYTQVSSELGTDLAEMRRKAEKSKAIPFGMERVSAQTEAKALLAMNEGERREYVRVHGWAHTVDMARRGKRNA